MPPPRNGEGAAPKDVVEYVCRSTVVLIRREQAWRRFSLDLLSLVSLVGKRCHLGVVGIKWVPRSRSIRRTLGERPSRLADRELRLRRHEHAPTTLARA